MVIVIIVFLLFSFNAWPLYSNTDNCSGYQVVGYQWIDRVRCISRLLHVVCGIVSAFVCVSDFSLRDEDDDDENDDDNDDDDADTDAVGVDDHPCGDT